jgi:hypothetical protein
VAIIDNARPAPTRPGWGFRVVLAVVVVMVVLAAGWPLASLAFSDVQPLPAGRTLVIGPSAQYSARFTVGGGWQVRKSLTDPKQLYWLRRGSVSASVVWVPLLSRSQAGRLWAGVLSLAQVNSPGARLIGPRPGRAGRAGPVTTGVLTRAGRSEWVTIYLSPARKFAVEIYWAAVRPGHAPDAADKKAVAGLIASVAFGGSRP